MTLAASWPGSWNAIDGEAHTVTVRLERGAMDAISAVLVEDDGHGISSDEVEATFGRIGDSWKKRSERTKNGLRILHGKLGEGRLRAFALGSTGRRRASTRTRAIRPPSRSRLSGPCSMWCRERWFPISPGARPMRV